VRQRGPRPDAEDEDEALGGEGDGRKTGDTALVNFDSKAGRVGQTNK
jgi:hypothetical protein